MIGSLATLIDRNIDDFDPIKSNDFIVDRHGNIKKDPRSKRTVLISRRFDNILANGGLLSLIFFDEAHTSALTDGGLILIQRLRELTDAMSVEPIKLLGATATPYRADNRSFSQVFDSIAINRTVRWFQQQGYLSPLSSAKFLTLGRTEFQTQNVLYVDKWAELMVKGWQEHGQDRPTIAFTGKIDSETGGVEAAAALAAAFNDAGVPAFTVNGQYTVDKDGVQRGADHREVLYEQFRAGVYKVYTAYNVGIFGLDLPNAECMIWARATEEGKQSPVIFPQALGRILRLSPDTGKEDAILLDYTGDPLIAQEHIDLLGLQVDPLAKYQAVPLDEEDEIDEEDERQFDMVDTKTVERISALTTNLLAFTIQVVRGGEQDWYINTLDNTLSLSVSQDDILIIVPPNLPKKRLPQQLMEAVQKEHFEGQGTSGFDSLKGLTPREYAQIAEFCKWLTEFYDRWTLWHVRKGKLVKKAWVASDQELGELQTKAATYVLSNVPSRVEQFSQKGKSWRYRPASAKQLFKLRQLMDPEDYGYFMARPESERRMGTVSKMISHMIGYEAINQILTQVNTILEHHS